MAGLGTESQQRLMSANAPKKTAPVEGNVGAVEETQIKRTFLPGLYNKVFSASQLNQQSQMHLSNKKKTIFKEYIERVEFNSTSDINLKGMGRLLVIRFSI